MSRINKIKGFFDLFPPESTSYMFMEDKAREIFLKYSYQELRTPILEQTELFARSIGQETDVVQKEMYTFPDRKGRSLTMRPEATAGVIRAFIDSPASSSGGVSRFFTLGPMFRYERPQKGRARQFHQVNAEMLGEDSPYADAEIISMLWAYLQALGLQEMTLEINSLGCPLCRPGFDTELKHFLAGNDPEVFCEDCRRRSDSNPLRVLDCKASGCRDMVAGAPRIVDNLCQGCKEHFDKVLEILNSFNIPFKLNPFLVRGLDYYQRTTFEVISDDIGSQSAVAGGGRYDGLVKDLGGPEIPGIGFACGMERLALLLRGIREKPLDFYLAVLHQDAMHKAMQLVQRLRGKGYHGEMGFKIRSVKSHLRQANKKKVKTCLLLGLDEMQKNQVQVKDMSTGVQRAVSQDDVEQALGLVFQPRNNNF
ncbi:histidine--tRNA ligase [Desulfonatronospira sp.]|uniref:histidine--tRNA ligase n=1 Tax=Desulfonatronospira sp. TaxID=1962951 RepID=UPI0025B9B4B6|nr:histidine--tRNA ligase [Desulfonatronospira sp.]